MNEKYEKKYQTSKDCGQLISSFVEKQKEDLIIGSYFIKIKELYSLLDLCENFDQMFEYIRKRILAIKAIHEQSDQFSELLKNLNNSIDNCEIKYKKLLEIYDDTLKTFEEYELILKDMDSLDLEMKQLMV